MDPSVLPNRFPTLIGVIFTGLLMIAAIHLGFWRLDPVTLTPQLSSQENPDLSTIGNPRARAEAERDRDEYIRYYKGTARWKQEKRLHYVRLVSWALANLLEVAAVVILVHPFKTLHRGLLWASGSIHLLLVAPLLLGALVSFAFEFEGTHPFAKFGPLFLFCAIVVGWAVVARLKAVQSSFQMQE